MSSRQLRCYLVPADMGLRKSVQQQHRRAGTTSGDEVVRLSDGTVPVLEPQ
jgi:hypothetical protein